MVCERATQVLEHPRGLRLERGQRGLRSVEVVGGWGFKGGCVEGRVKEEVVKGGFGDKRRDSQVL
jgi:hypothetical protein